MGWVVLAPPGLDSESQWHGSRAVNSSACRARPGMNPGRRPGGLEHGVRARLEAPDLAGVRAPWAKLPLKPDTHVFLGTLSSFTCWKLLQLSCWPSGSIAGALAAPGPLVWHLGCKAQAARGPAGHTSEGSPHRSACCSRPASAGRTSLPTPRPCGRPRSLPPPALPARPPQPHLPGP